MRPSGKSPEEQHIHHTVTRDKGSRDSDLQLEQLLVAMALNDIKEMKENVDTNYKAFKKEVQEIRGYLKNAKTESESMEHELSSSFQRLKDMFFYEDRDNLPEVLYDMHPLMSRPLEMKAIAQMRNTSTQVKEEIPIIVELLRTIRRELEKLGKKTKETTDDMLRELADIKNDARLHHLSLQASKAGLDKKFVELEELIQGCCTIKKIPLSIFEGTKE